MSVDVVTEIEIARPVDEVCAFSSHPDRAPEWYENIESVEWKSSPGEVAVGARVAFVARFLGRRLAYTYEIVTWEENERLVMTTAEGPFPMETTYRWERVGEGATRMTLRNRGMPTGFAKITAPLMVRAMRRANENDLWALKTLLEGRHATKG